MPRIDIDYNALRSTLADIQEYIAAQERIMAQADFDIKSMLCIGWLGADAREFEQKWAGVNAEDSEAKRLCHSLIEFHQNIKKCIMRYRMAQASAKSRASLLY